MIYRALDKFRNPVATDCAMHDADVIATDWVPKENQSWNNHISNLQTKRNEYDYAVVLAQWYLLPARVQTNWALFRNKIHQT
tara:strand:- start:427 stop:672 length:246 start_codon:yes stop_codon:yes gene_type:complete